jgi:phospholipase C
VRAGSRRGSLTTRSRDNLPNPQQSDDDDAYVPRNMPAIGDLFELYFDHHRDGDRLGDGERGGDGHDRF